MTMTMTDADSAYHKILDKIVRAELAPGSLVNEAELMNNLGLGRTPIREALKRLQVEKFVDVFPRRGIFIAPLTYTEINRIYEVRVELEGIGVRLAADRRTTTQIQEIEKFLEENKITVITSIERLIELDREFHFRLYGMVHNLHLMGDLQRYYYMSQRIWYHCYEFLQPSFVGLADHPAIFEAVKQKDSDYAEKRMRGHIMHFQNYIKEYIL